jgi:hypothetical protein
MGQGPRGAHQARASRAACGRGAPHAFRAKVAPHQCLQGFPALVCRALACEAVTWLLEKLQPGYRVKGGSFFLSSFSKYVQEREIEKRVDLRAGGL